MGILIAIPVTVYGILIGASTLSAPMIRADYLKGLYDCEANLGSAIFEYDSERSFLGDGYSLSVYALPSAISGRFTAADTKLLSEYPKHPSYRDHWSFEHWREGPFDEKSEDYLGFALSNYDAGNASELTSHFKAIRTALARKGTFYAFFYNSNSGGYVADIDLFIVDLNARRLYSINHNT